MYITLEMLENYTGKYTEEEENSLAELYLKAAEEKVASYLGYNPEAKEHECTLIATGYEDSLLALKAPVISIESVVCNGNDITEKILKTERNHIIFSDTLFSCGDEVSVKFTGGIEEVPATVKMCALKIASLYWESAGGNLAVSSTSFADTNTRVFNNYKISRFLEEIEEHRIYG